MSETQDPKPTPPPPSSTRPTPLYLEKYFDLTYQIPYYFNPATGESLWDPPADAVIADMTIVQKQQSEQ